MNKLIKIVLIVLISITVILIAIFIAKIYVQPEIEDMKRGISVHMKKHPEWYRNEFPEYAFKPLEQYRIEYEKAVYVGYKIMKRSTFIIAGLARDCKDKLGL